MNFIWSMLSYVVPILLIGGLILVMLHDLFSAPPPVKTYNSPPQLPPPARSTHINRAARRRQRFATGREGVVIQGTATRVDNQRRLADLSKEVNLMELAGK
jgi:hypothetical protein